MKSPLNISETAKRYGLDEDLILKQKLIAFDTFIWQNCHIKTIDELVAFEKKYQEFDENFAFCYDAEEDEFSPVFMCNGEMVLLCNGTFQKTSRSKGELHIKLLDAGLSDLESVYVRTFLANNSGIYRKDSYKYGIPPFIQSICDGLNNALTKLPTYSNIVVRACNCYDKVDFVVGEIFTPGFCLTCSADYLT